MYGNGPRDNRPDGTKVKIQFPSHPDAPCFYPGPASGIIRHLFSHPGADPCRIQHKAALRSVSTSGCGPPAFYKTRSLARDQIDGGKVHYNGQRTKPGKPVEVGALVRFWQGQDEREVRVLEVSEQRNRPAGPATL